MMLRLAVSVTVDNILLVTLKPGEYELLLRKKSTNAGCSSVKPASGNRGSGTLEVSQKRQTREA